MPALQPFRLVCRTEPCSVIPLRNSAASLGERTYHEHIRAMGDSRRLAHILRATRSSARGWLLRLLRRARLRLIGYISPPGPSAVTGGAPPVKNAGNRWITGGRPSDKVTHASAVEPDVLHAPAVVLAVGHDGEVLDPRLSAGAEAHVVDDRPRAVLLELPVDLPDQPLALVAVGQGRLLDKELLQVRVAVGGVVALRTAAVILEELLVGVVDPAAGIVEADLVILARQLGEPVGGLDRFEFGVDPDLLELVD